ncbi:MAG: hypothetical protein DMF24_05740 [Verrucomicrobia bacterium]|nr:MAG: hypothetical protein DMF24_05740 [Verrucomicrobiota bacterium]
MYKQIKVIAIFVSFLMLASLSTAIAQRPTPTPRPRNFAAGAVYVLTNQVSNAVAVFLRTARGALTSAGEFSTGGAGNPVPQGMDPATDPLASQGALILVTWLIREAFVQSAWRFTRICCTCLMKAALPISLASLWATMER